MFLFLLFVGFAAAQYPSNTDTNEAHDEWIAFKAQYNKVYSNEIEENFRMMIFVENKLMIEKHNQKYEKGLVSYSQGINKFADLLHSEFIATHTGYRKTSSDTLNQTTFVLLSNGTIPDSVDWRDKGAVTGIKDQIDCGADWAFSTTGALEGQVFMQTKKLVALSEQDLVDCSRTFGCETGDRRTAYAFIKSRGGIDIEASYPYVGLDGPCM